MSELLAGLSDLGSLVSFDLTGLDASGDADPGSDANATISLPIQADFLEIMPTSPDTTLAILWPNLEDPGTITVDLPSGLLDLPNFTNMDAGTFVSLLGQITNWLEDFRRNFGVTDIPFVGPTLDEVLAFADLVSDTLLFDDGDDDIDDNTWLITDVNEALVAAGIDDKIVAEADESDGGAVSLYAISSGVTEFKVSGDGLGFGAVRSAVAHLERLELAGTSPAPVDGILGGDVTLNVAINGDSAVAVKIAATATASNTGLGNDRRKLLDANNRATFTTVDEMARQFNHITGSADKKVFYDPVTEELTLELSIGDVTSDSNFGFLDLPIQFDLLQELAPVAELSSDSMIRLSAGGGLDLTIGVYLGDTGALELSDSTLLADLRDGIEFSDARTIAAPNPARTVFGRLSEDDTFHLARNGDPPVAILLPLAQTENNATLADLASDINTAIGGTSLASLVTASVDDKGTPGNQADDQIVLSGNGATTSLVLTAQPSDPVVREIGFGADQAAADESGIRVLRATVPGLVGRPSQDVTFNLSLNTVNGGAATPVTIEGDHMRANRNILDVVVDVQRAMDAVGFRDKIEVGSQGLSLLFKTLEPGATSFSMTASGNATTELGLPASASGTSVDLIITTRDGIEHAIVLDTATTLGQVISTIESGTGNGIDVQFTGNDTRLLLVDQTSGSNPLLVNNAFGSNAAADLGILRAMVIEPDGGAPEGDELPPQDRIESGLLGGVDPLERLFIRNTQATARLGLSTPGGINAVARFGFVGIAGTGNITGLNGTGAMTGNISVGLKPLNAVAFDPAAKITLKELIDNAANIAGFLDGPTIDGDGKLQLAVSITPAFTEIDTAAEPKLTIEITSLAEILDGGGDGVPGYTISTSDFDELLNFDEVGFSDIIAALRALADFLQQFEEFRFLDENIPVIDVSINDLLAFAEDFNDALEEMERNPTGTVQVLERNLKDAMGIPRDSPLLGLKVDGEILRIDLKFEPSFSESIPIDLSLPIQSGSIDLSGNADLRADGDLDLQLAVGIDLNNLGDFWIFEDTGIVGTFAAAAEDIAFTAALGGIGARIVGGDAAIAADFSLGLDPAAMTAGSGADRRAELSVVLGNLGDAVDFSLTGAIDGTLPVYFPTESLFRGDIEIGGALSLESDGGLQLNGTLADPGAIADGFLLIPDEIFDIDFGQFSALDNLLLIIDGVDGFLGLLQDGLDGEIAGFTVPLIGDQLAEATDVIGDFRKDFIDGLRDGIQTADDPDENFISQMLFELLNDDLNILADRNNDELVNIADIQLQTNVDDVGVAATDVFMQWNMKLGSTLVDAGAGLDFDMGIPGLGFETRGEIDVQVDWELDMGFGVGISRGGFYLDISDTNELEINVDVTLPNAGLTGTLAFLQIDADNNGATGLGAIFAVDLVNQINPSDTLLGIAELGELGIEIGVAADAIIDLGLELKLNSDLVPTADSVFPKVVADFVLEWGIGDRGAGTLVGFGSIGNSIEYGLKIAEFSDVGLDLGSFITDFLGPIVGQVQEFTKPLQPVIDIVTAPIPVISDLAGSPVSLIDIAAAFGDVEPDLIYAIADLVNLVNSIPDPANVGSLILPFGDFTVYDNNGGSGFQPALWDSGFNPSNGGIDVGSRLPQFSFEDALDSIDTSGSPPSSSTTKTFTNGLANNDFGDFISFPIFQDPSNIFGLLMGNNPTLITLDLPPLGLEFVYNQYFPIFGPLGASITGRIGLTLDPPEFGYDTLGLRDFFDSDFRDTLALFNGLFLSSEEPVIIFTGGISAGVQINLGVAKAGVEGGIFIEVNFTLHDADQDGKVRLYELATNFINEAKFGSPALAPLAIFDVSGEVFAKLFAFLEVDLFILSIDETFDITPPITIVDFNIPFARKPTLATELSDGVLRLNMGEFASKRVEGNIQDVSEKFFVSQVDSDTVKVWAPDLGVAEGQAQKYDVTSRLIAQGGQGDDEIDASAVTAAIVFDFEGGAGSDTLITGLAGSAKIEGGAGDDHIEGTDQADVIDAGLGNDFIDGKGGNDLIFADDGKIGEDGLTLKVGALGGDDVVIGGAGNDVIFGGGGSDKLGGDLDPRNPDPDMDPAGNDTIIGDGGLLTLGAANAFLNVVKFENTSSATGGADIIFGHRGNDIIYAGGGNDKIKGGEDNDTLHGESGFNIIDGNAGNDFLYGGDDADTLRGGPGADVLFGFAGGDILEGEGDNDEIHGGPGADVLRGDAGQDMLYGDGDPDKLYGGDDNDTLDGGASGDILEGGDGNDTIHGGPGGDILRGEAGQDMLYGDGGPDELYGGDDNDTLDGGAGDDQVFGQGGHDFLIGGNGTDSLDGQAGNDRYSITFLGGTRSALIDVQDTGPDPDSDVLSVTGTAFDDHFLLRANTTAPNGLAFVANINGDSDAERINYDGVERMLVTGSLGNDQFAVDDVLTETTLDGGLGHDTFQVGQLYKSERNQIQANLGDERDEFEPTIPTTRGFLSNGISRPMTISGGPGNDNFVVFHNKAVLTLNGEEGDDTFSIRAFALAGSQDSERERTDLSGGAGADLIEYSVNAPVNIDGGDGFDTVIVIGTEFGEDFVVTEEGVYGAGLNVNFVNVESLKVDGAEGDDRFFVLSTSEKFVTQIAGGLGSDTFNMAGDTPPIISNDLLGHSGIVVHDVESVDPDFDGVKVPGISANVADNDEPGIVIRETAGGTMVAEGGQGDTYTVVLARAPMADVRVSVAAPLRTDQEEELLAKSFLVSSSAAGAQNNPQANTVVLAFTPANWNVPQTVVVSAWDDADDLLDYDDDAIEGTKFGVITHVITVVDDNGDEIPDDAFAGSPSAVTENTLTDSSATFPTAAEGLRGRRVLITDGPGKGQQRLILSNTATTLTLRNGQWLETPTAASKYVIQMYAGVVAPAVTVEIHDNDAPGLIVTQANAATPAPGDGDGSTAVIEGGVSDQLEIALSHAPTGQVSVHLEGGSQLGLSDASLNFDGGNWNTPQIVSVTAIDDVLREGFHHGFITIHSTSDTDIDQSLPATDTIDLTAEPNVFAGLSHKPRTDLAVTVKVDSAPLTADRFEVISNKVLFYDAGGQSESIDGVVEVSYSYLDPGYHDAAALPIVADVADNDVSQVLIQETLGSTNVIEGADTDTYTVMLTRQPAADVAVRVTPQITKTTTSIIRNDLVQVQVTSAAPGAVNHLDGTATLNFTPANWDQAQSVLVTAIDDAVVDGGDTKVFAPALHTLDGIQGPIVVQGAAGNGSINIGGPVLLPGETNIRAATGNVVAVEAGSLTASTTDLLNLDDIDELDDLVERTVEITEGPGTGQFRLIIGVNDLGGTAELLLNEDWELAPQDLLLVTKYAVTSMSLNFFVKEEEQVDFMTLFHEDSLADSVGTMSHSRVSGFGMGPDLTIGGRLQGGGITYEQLEVVQLKLGAGDDDLDLTGAPTREDGYQTWTIVQTGAGDDQVTVSANAAETIVAGGTANSGTASTLLDASAAFSTTGLGLQGQLVRITGGTGSGQERTILSNSYREITVSLAWETVPDATSVYEVVDLADGAISISTGEGIDHVDASAADRSLIIFGDQGVDTLTGGGGDDLIFGDSGRLDYFDEDDAIITRLGTHPDLDTSTPEREIQYFGTASAAVAATLTDSAASFPLGQENLTGLFVRITNGTGAQQRRMIVSNTATVLTLDEPWDIPPDNDSTFRIYALSEDQTDGVVRDPRWIMTVAMADSGADIINGGGGNDLLLGGFLADTIHGGPGEDRIYGHGIHGDNDDGAADLLFGDGERDQIHGQDGDDQIRGGDGHDDLFGEAGADTIHGEAGDDQAYGGAGGDTLHGGADNDILFGQTGGDTLNGDGGDDYLDGGPGMDTLNGGLANDVLFAGTGLGNVLNGNEGDDRITGADEGADTDPDFSDANYFGDVIDGGPGNDQIWALGGADLILGGEDDDRIDSGRGADDSRGGAGDDWIFAGHGLGDTIQGGPGDDEIYGSHDGADTITGGPGNDDIRGQGGDDVIDGGGDHDLIDGGPGTDDLGGGEGDDEILGGGGVGDTLRGEGGDDLLRGSNDGGDVIFGGPGRDRAFGNGGNDQISGGGDDDILEGGAGDDVISGDAGSDLILGGADHDVIYALNAAGTGADSAVDYAYGDFGTHGNEPGSGRDQIFGDGGIDYLFGEGNDDLIDDDLAIAGIPDPTMTTDMIEYAGGEGVDPTTFVTPAATPDPPLDATGAMIVAGPTLPSGPTFAGRWTEFGSSATGAGLSGHGAVSLEPGVAINSAGKRYVAWADARHGNYEIYVAVHQSGSGWTQLAGSAQAGGLSDTASSSRRPAVAIGADDNPIVAWTERTLAGSVIRVASWDPAADSGLGAWTALGTSLAANGISGAGERADDPLIVDTPSGPVVAWLDSSTGTTNVYVRRYSGGAWNELAGSASGGGVSNSASDVADLALASDGDNVAVAWTQTVGGRGEIYLRQFSGGTWGELDGSATAGGVSKNSGDSFGATLAYHDGDLFAAWEDDTSGFFRIYATRFTAGTWGEAGTGSYVAEGVSAGGGRATEPGLAAQGDQLMLAWRDNLVATNVDAHPALYVRQWSGTEFVEEVAGDARRQGVSLTGGVLLDSALALDANGSPLITWFEPANSQGEIYLRGNTFQLTGTTFTAGGTPGNTVQEILDANELGTGDLILVSGTFAAGFSITPADAGVTVIGTPQSSLTGDVQVTGNDVILQRLHITGNVTATSAERLTLRESTIVGTVTVEGGSDVQLSHNTIQAGSPGIVLAGNTDGANVWKNTIVGGDQGIALGDPAGVLAGGAFNVQLHENATSASTTGLLITSDASGNIFDNDFSATATGLEMDAGFTGPIDHNRFHDATVGVRYDLPLELSENDIFNNTTGVIASIDSNVDGLGYVSGTELNRIFNNATGVELTGLMRRQHVFGNTVGVTGAGVLGDVDLDGANRIEGNDFGVRAFVGTVQFNQIAGNVTGIEATSDQILLHNLMVDNTTTGILVSGQNDVRIVGNTIYSPLGDNIRLNSGASEIEIRNNILWAEGGYDIFVANDSQAGFFSDYNNLYATGAGKLVHWILASNGRVLDFDDILDWQEDIHRYDLHSIGRTELQPTGAEPRFVNRHWGDFEVFGQPAGQRFTSPTIDAGDPLVDEGLPASYQNLLTNPGFENGLTGWTTNLTAVTRMTSPAPFAGDAYYFAETNMQGFAEQTIDLVAVGLDPAALDSQDLVAVFGGRVRSADETVLDRGKLTLTFLNAAGATIDEQVVLSSNPIDRWELFGDRIGLPTGTRSIRFRFDAIGDSGVTADSYLDHTFLYVHADTIGPDQGAGGHAPTDSARSPTPRLALRTPDLYVDFERDRPHELVWDSYGNIGDAGVRIDLLQDTAAGPVLLANISPVTEDDGQFTWTPANTAIDFGTFGLRIRISMVDNPTVLDRSSEAFAVPEDGADFFVNDRDTTDDQLTTAAGDNRNTGKTAATPKPYPNNLLRTYTLSAGDTVFVDTGSYPTFDPTVFSGTGLRADDEGFTMAGPDCGGAQPCNRTATITHAHPATVAPIIELDDADFVTLQNLTLINGQTGLLLTNSSTAFVGSRLSINGSQDDGVRIDSDSSATSLGNITSFNNQRYGVFVDGTLGALTGSNIHNNGATGVYLFNPGSVSVEANEIYNNTGDGIYVRGSGTVGNLDLSLGRGNLIHDNAHHGIQAHDNVIIAGNTIFGHVAEPRAGLYLTGFSGLGPQAIQNVVYDNYSGIHDTFSQSQIEHNRVYNNSNLGITTAGSPVRGNVVYSNQVGVVAGFSTADVSNNLIYDNAVQGLLVQARSGVTEIVNNTIYQPTGDAIQIKGGSRDVQLRNNILWVDDGFDISVAGDSQNGFASDFNLLHVTGSGEIAFWQGLARPTLAAWQNAAFTDVNSLSQDPLFVDIDGSDNTLGFANLTNDGRDDDYHLQSLFGSQHGGTLAPVVDVLTGLPVLLPGMELVDSLQSPAIDRGDAADGFASEPASNGGFINLGAFGDTSQASKSPLEYVLVTRPDGGEVWPANRTFTVGWRSHVFTGTVDIELIQVGIPDPVLLIADDTANDGEFVWLIPDTVPPADNYFIRVSQSGSNDVSNTAFSITAPITVYYVNDATVNVEGDLTTAAGDDLNDGLSLDSPKASIRAVLETFDLGVGDVIRVDAGTYNLSSNIIVTAADAGVRIEGYRNDEYPDRRSLLNRGNTSTGSYVFELAGADDVTIANLSITGGEYGIHGPSNADSDNVTISGNEVFANSSTGIRL
ncbi:MAG: hypothetical protein CMJ81_17005, partial [Planctomycetaceae bacterium]|nr:hypothetical protein [Planctomycetaceae bacterium]